MYLDILGDQSPKPRRLITEALGNDFVNTLGINVYNPPIDHCLLPARAGSIPTHITIQHSQHHMTHLIEVTLTMILNIFCHTRDIFLLIFKSKMNAIYFP